MASSTALAPSTSSVGGAAHTARLAALAPDIIARSNTTGWEPWLAHVAPAAGCSSPVRLSGDLVTADTTTGQVLAARSTHSMPDGVVYKACGTRRAALCPSCAKTYQHDAFHLIRAGLVGGKTVPDTVAGHPAVFATFTAPAFGPVHAGRTDRIGKPLPCHARRDAPTCPHGVRLSCTTRHREGDREIGQPLCLDCYDHDAQVVWNIASGELWRRTRIALDRALSALARSRGIDPATVRLRYVKVAEFQRRGAIHFHALIRLDGHSAIAGDLVIPPPAGFTADDIAALVADTAPGVAFTTPGHPERPGGWDVQWGRQLDVQTITLGTGDLTEGHAAGYLAKYATKATEDTGHLSGRLTSATVEHYADPEGDHIARLIAACWYLGEAPEWSRLRRWAHMLGFGGHFMTKARVWSTTLAALRAARADWTRCQREVDTDAPDTTVLVNHLVYDGQGWHTEADALLANSAAARSREQRQIASEESKALHANEV